MVAKKLSFNVLNASVIIQKKHDQFYSARHSKNNSIKFPIPLADVIVLTRHTEMLAKLVLPHKAFLYPIQQSLHKLIPLTLQKMIISSTAKAMIRSTVNFTAKRVIFAIATSNLSIGLQHLLQKKM